MWLLGTIGCYYREHLNKGVPIVQMSIGIFNYTVGWITPSFQNQSRGLIRGLYHEPSTKTSNSQYSRRMWGPSSPLATGDLLLISYAGEPLPYASCVVLGSFRIRIKPSLRKSVNQVDGTKNSLPSLKFCENTATRRDCVELPQQR